MSNGLVLDAGALIAIDRGDRRTLRLLESARRFGLGLVVTAPVVAQALRNASRQARLSAFLRRSEVERVPFNVSDARAVGALVAACGHNDVVDVHMVLQALRRAYGVVTSDPDDVRRVDANVAIVEV